MTAKLYVIGVGPGDPDLLTLKACRILTAVPCVCAPKARREGSSLALSIVSRVIDLKDKEIIEGVFPMVRLGSEGRKPENRAAGGIRGLGSGRGRSGGQISETGNPDESELDDLWNETALKIIKRLNNGIDVAFITLGDPAFFSTYFYLHDRLLGMDAGIRIEIVPGISSINAAAARAGISLGIADDKLAVIPATYAGDLKELIASFDTIVLMKVHDVFDAVLKNIIEAGAIRNSVYISRAGMADEKIVRDLRKVEKSDLNYFSVVIVRGNNHHG
jgi:precorrin-2/cobalt-factor-2 C20-methyltransferase